MNKKIKLLATSFILLFSISSFAQTKEEAINAYNKAVSLSATDLPQAIKSMIESSDIAAKVGVEADTIGQMAQQQIPTLQYNYATALYNEKKMDEAITNFKLAHVYAVKYNDPATKAKAAGLLPKLYLSKGANEYKAGTFAAAVDSYQKALEYDSTMARAYLNMGLAYKKLNKDAEMKQAFNKAIEKGTATNDGKTVEAARKTMSNDLLVDASGAFKKNDFKQTVALLGDAVKYSDTNPEIYYLYAVSLNKLSKWDDALAQAEKGLAIEENTDIKKARFYFEIGNSQAGKGENGNACASYKKAAFGSFAESANYQIKTVLKCK